MQSTISIIIPTIFKRPLFINDLLESLHEQVDCDSLVEILIIDNNPNPNKALKMYVNSWKKKLSLRIVHEPRNGLHNARHTGAREAKGSILIYIDDDIRANPGWLSAYEKLFMSEAIICAGGKVLPEWETSPPEWINSIPDEIFSLLDYGEKQKILGPKDGINGCNFAIRKYAIFNYKGFHPDGFSDPTMKWYRGDGEYGLIQKIKKANIPVYYCPQASLQHRIPKSRMDISEIKRNVADHAISQAYTFIRHKECSWASIFIIFFGGLLLFLINSLLHLFVPNKTKDKEYEMKRIKYSNIFQYGFQVFINPDLKSYILLEDYLNY